VTPRLSDLLLRSQSDERLVNLARTGHDRAFAAIVQRYRAELMVLARHLTSDGRAEDLLQQAFLSAFAALRSGAEVQHLRGWLYQIVRNAATKAKRPGDLPLDQVDVAGEPLEETVVRRARALAAMSELARLPERQRSALVATALNGRPHADVALSMGISEQAVRQLVHRARGTVRGAVTGITPWPLVRWLAATPNGATPPEVAVTAGAISSTGAAVKLGALFAATGALATGVVAGPLRHEHRQSVEKSATTRTLGAQAGAVARTARLGSPEYARALQVRGQAPDSGFSRRDSRLRRSAAPPAEGRGARLIVPTSANPSGAGVQDRIEDRHGGVSAPVRQQGPGTSENGSQSGATPYEGSGSGGHDGQVGRGSSQRTGSDSEASRSGTAGGSNSTAGESGGGALSGHDGTSSVSDESDGSTTALSSVPSSGSSPAGGESDGGSSSSDGGGGGRSGSRSDTSFSDTSADGD
jgi:RNA polymerase sigma factor (sigma-70 family)